MTISRDTFDPAKNYKRIRYHQDRDEKTGAQNAQGKSQDLSQRILSEEYEVLTAYENPTKSK